MDENKDNGNKKLASLPSYTHDMNKLFGRDKVKDLPSRNSSFSSLTPGASLVQRSPSLFTAEEETVPLLRTLDSITRMIGLLTATTLENWSMVLEVCERCSASDTNAKEAVSALRRELGKHGEPSTQLSAARLWAIMLRDSTETFISQSTSKKFLGTLEDVIMFPRTSPVVRERVLNVIAAAAYLRKEETSGFRALWRKVKPDGKPDEGIPFDTGDAMFSPSVNRHYENAVLPQDPDSFPLSFIGEEG